MVCQPDTCVICLDPITELCEARPCKHRHYDYLCLLSWLQQRPACPLCNANVREVWYDFDSSGAGGKAYFPPRSTPLAETSVPAAPPARSVPRVCHFHNELNCFRCRRRRQRLYPPPARTPPAAESLARRRLVYRHRLYSLHVGANRLSRYRDFTPQGFAANTEMQSRARKWIRRELQVFEFLAENPASTADAQRQRRRANNAEFLLEYIIAILKTVDTQGSCGQAEEMLQEFLGRDNTRLFLHELRAWLRSPHLSIEAWDRAVQYNDRMPVQYATMDRETLFGTQGFDGRKRRTNTNER